MKRVRREKAREERAAKRQEKQTVKAKEERRETASKKYAEWSIRKIRRGRKSEGAGPEKRPMKEQLKEKLLIKNGSLGRKRSEFHLKLNRK